MLRRLGRALAGAGFDVLLLDLAPPPTLADAPLPSLEFAAVDVRDEAGGNSGGAWWRVVGVGVVGGGDVGGWWLSGGGVAARVDRVGSRGGVCWAGL